MLQTTQAQLGAKIPLTEVAILVLARLVQFAPGIPADVAKETRPCLMHVHGGTVLATTQGSKFEFTVIVEATLSLAFCLKHFPLSSGELPLPLHQK